jgi:DnaJ-class molecular chaperone
MATTTALLTPEQAEAICPACLGSGSRADELKLPGGSAERDTLAAQPCATCRGRGALAPRLRRFSGRFA